MTKKPQLDYQLDFYLPYSSLLSFLFAISLPCPFACSAASSPKVILLGLLSLLSSDLTLSHSATLTKLTPPWKIKFFMDLKRVVRSELHCNSDPTGPPLKNTNSSELLKNVICGNWVLSSWTAMLGRTTPLANELINFQATHVQSHWMGQVSLSSTFPPPPAVFQNQGLGTIWIGYVILHSTIDSLLTQGNFCSANHQS